MVHPYWVGHAGVTNAHFGLTVCSALWLIAYCPGSLCYLNCSPYSGYVRAQWTHDLRPKFFHFVAVFGKFGQVIG